MRRGSQPAWLIMLIAAALVFAGWYLWQGLQTYLRSGGLGVQEAVQQAEQQASATVIRALTSTVIFAPPPTRTPIPECQPFVVVVKEAIVRTEPSREARIKRALFEGDEVCVIAPASTNPDWLLVDEEPRSRRIESVYMHRSLIRAVNPTADPGRHAHAAFHNHAQTIRHARADCRDYYDRAHADACRERHQPPAQRLNGAPVVRLG